MESLANKVILITGASTGIGGFTARYLSNFKAKLVLVARSAGKLKEVQQQCEEAGAGKGNVAVVVADLAKHEDLIRVIPEAVAAFGQLDALVNNAAAYVYYDVEHTSPESYDRTMAVNIRAPFFLSQAAIPHLKKTKGSIVNISSIASQRVLSFVAAYCISKAALDQFTRVLALELAPSGVRVNALTVGFTKTDTAEVMSVQGDTLDEMSNPKIVPLGGHGTMEDVAKVVGFLLSDLSAAMTGTCVPVDRGTLVTFHSLSSEKLEACSNAGYINSVATEVLFERKSQQKAGENAKQAK